MECLHTKEMFPVAKHNNNYYSNGPLRKLPYFKISYFLPTQNNTIQPTLVTAKYMLSDTLVHYKSHTYITQPSHLYPRLHLVCTYFIYWDDGLFLYNRAYFCHIVDAIVVMT